MVKETILPLEVASLVQNFSLSSPVGLTSLSCNFRGKCPLIKMHECLKSLGA